MYPTKRIRLSSPTFDDQLQQPSQVDIHAFDALDQRLSQSRIDPLKRTPDDAPDEVDHAAWFSSDSSTSESFVGFSTAAALPGFQRPSASGKSAKSLFVPSAAALRAAEEKMRKWQEDDRQHNEPGDSSHATPAALPSPAAFSSAKNAFSFIQPPESPTPTSFPRSESTSPRSHRSFQTLGVKRQSKPFKTPLSLPYKQAPTPRVDTPTPSTNAAVLPLRPSLVANHAETQVLLGFTPRRVGATRPKFVTPFKAGVKHGTRSTFPPERSKLPVTPSNTSIASRIYPSSVPSSSRPSKRDSNRRVFDLTLPPGRRTLATSGLHPQVYTTKQLGDMGINFRELSQVNPRTALFYTFTTQSSPPGSSDLALSPAFDRSVVLQELSAKGCTLAKQAWVDNHWPLVLWKLAGMAVLDPVSESDPFKKRWHWSEVIRQFMYRYERDLNGSSRPPLRLITARDASAESPMVLCISDIIWPADRSEHNAGPIQSHPELEVTDGWYRLRARIDAPLARGIKKGKIKTGRKIAVASAKLLAERKEGCEILEAYNSNALLLSGNSTHMAPWHAKLGFQRGPMIATLRSLTPDGGNVAVMMLTITKAYPVAYIEYVEDASGQKRREGPHDTKEEQKLVAQWKTKRELHAAKLWSEFEKRRHRLLDHAERLEQHVAPGFKPARDDSPPDKIYDMYDTLREDLESGKKAVSSIDQEDAGWLARHIRDRAVQESEQALGDIEQELESVCPPRDVKAFCVLVAKDTRTQCPSKRTAQVTVWNIPGEPEPESCGQGPFMTGQRYLVTNLVPTQVSAWMCSSSDGEVYLATRKNSKWTLVN